jgi:hypothetical protein
MPVAGDYQMGAASNRAFENSIICFVFGYGIHRNGRSDNFGNLGHQLEMPNDLVFLPLETAEDLGDLPHDGRRNQQDKASFHGLPPNPKGQACRVNKG